MATRAKILLVAVLVFGAGALGGAAAPAANAELRPVEGWTCVFAGQQARRSFVLTSRRAFKGRLGWAIVMGRATVARKEMAIEAAADRATTIRLDLRLPPTKPGVIMPADLVISVYELDGQNAMATLQQRLWLFPKDPFVGRKTWLKDLNIHLFDPEGSTRGVLAKAGVPFKTLRNVDALPDLVTGLLIIGEGTSFRQYRALGEMMTRAAAGGVRVLCLAPKGGRLVVPGTDGADLPSPLEVRWRRNDVIAELDKRLDTISWPGDGKVAGSTLTAKAFRGRVVADVAKDDKGWPWLDVRFAAKGRRRGRLVICGFQVINKWNAGPTPRYLFARILENMSERGGKPRSEAGTE